MKTPNPGMDERIGAALGDRVVASRSLGGGCVADVRLIELAGGDRVVAKSGGGGPGHSYELEAWMLGVLGERSDLPVPAVLHAEADLLVMEHVETGGSSGVGGEAHAAELLASLHAVSPRGEHAGHFGLERDTLIGPLAQPNGWMESWPRFYAERRLLPFGRLALQRGGIDEATMGLVERVAGRLDALIGTGSEPSLIHGDVWGGNVLWRGGRVAAFIDPAVHYADAEIELAFTTLFGTFGDAFFARYHELRPIREGFFEARRELYLLQPLLVHAALFGASYGAQVRGIARRFG